MVKQKKGLYRKIRNKGFVVIILLLVSLMMIFYSSTMSEFVQYKIYNFEIRVEHESINKPVFNSFHFYYDYTKGQGNITFEITSDYNISTIIFELPVILDNNTARVVIKDCKSDECEKIISTKNYNVKYKSNTVIFIGNFHDSLEDTKIEILLNINLEPMSIISFYHPDVNVCSNEHIRFDLGNNYKCADSCLAHYRNIEINRNTLGKIISINFDESKDYHMFTINTVKEDTLFWKNLILSLGSSLLGGLILIICEILMGKHLNF